ncbi:MAG TPA: RHS repeat-associated core domain-containing protein, partial [Polyangium sp.]|nr:RHS repeat-associated core domain-containing protein [Polyangium sp.]
EGMTQTVGGDSFAARQGYDDLGRVKSVDYPQPLGEEPFGVTYERDEHGFVIGVREKNTNESFWALTEVDDAGRIQKERFGNDVETTRDYYHDKQTLKGISTTLGPTNVQKLTYDWDLRLNLKSRTDSLQPQNKTERFRYDELDRVTCAYFGAVENAMAPCASSYSYMLNGNLWEKSDVGTYSYDPKHPHAVSHVPGETFGYDDVGNQITRPGGVLVTYAPFDLPKTITKGGKTISFGYDGDQQRIRKTSPTAETLYFGDIFEQVTSAAGVVERRFYVHSPERAIAVVPRGGATPGTRFFHIDHLGSIETITKDDGTVDERRSYDVFGARRNPEWGGPSGSLTSRTTRGFTGHEEDDEIGLVNMRGRMFDPRLGRFTTTDAVIADIWNGQSLNRYSYVFNNPLAFVDPTGFVPDDPAPGTTKTHSEPPPPSIGNLVFSDNVVPLPQKNMAPTPLKQAAEVGAHTPPVDTSTTGNGGENLPRQTTPPEPAPPPPLGLWDGVWDGVVNLYDHLDEMVPGSTANTVANLRTVVDIYQAYKQGDVIDAINVVKPLMGVATLGFAIDDEDWYTVGQQAGGVGVAILGIVVARKTIGAGKGARTTRGPPIADGALVKPSKGPGSVPPAQRDPRRHFSPKERAARLEEQGGICANCGEQKTLAETRGHHTMRHADGGRTVPENHVEVCADCHKDLHR